jgi:hypothetical protein
LAEGERSDFARLAQLHAEGEQMVANMRTSAMTEFAKIPSVVAQVNSQQLELKRLRVAAEQETATRKRSAEAGANASNGGVASGGPASSVAAPSQPTESSASASGRVWDEVATYYDCIGTVKKHTGAGDVTDTIYYGIVTSSRMDIDSARELFRQHTGTDAPSGTEYSGASCHPYKSRAEAQAANNEKIARDAKGTWRQVTGIDLSL